MMSGQMQINVTCRYHNFYIIFDSYTQYVHSQKYKTVVVTKLPCEKLISYLQLENGILKKKTTYPHKKFT